MGGAECWGEEGLGDGTWTDRHTPVAVSGLPAGVIAISAGGDHTCALTRKDGVECWGDNMEGALGDGTLRDRSKPVRVSGLASGVTAISAGDGHTCALTSVGGVKCWGDNEFGQLGDRTIIDRHTPVGVFGLASGVTAIAAGGAHTCALTSAGGVKCWGDNQFGQLGDPAWNDRAKPVDVPGLASAVTAIAAGWDNTCALMNAGTVECWGENDHGQLGNGTRSHPLGPVRVSGLASATAIAVGLTGTCALTSARRVKCWGYNRNGEVGDGTKHDRLRPVAISGLAAGVTAISAGDFHTCALISRARVKCWGGNDVGQLGDGTTIRSLRPIGVAGFGGSVNCGVRYLVGKRLARARTMIVRANCRVGQITRVTSDKRKGIVIGQSAPPNTRLKKGSKVDLVVSRGR